MVVSGKKREDEVTGLSQQIRGSGHPPNWERSPIIAKEADIIKLKFKGAV